MSDSGALFDPFAPGYIENPYAQFARLRADDPVHDTPFGAVYVSRYDDAVALLRSPDVSVDPANANPSPLDDIAAAALGEQAPEERISRSMLDKDPPDHTRLRKLVSKAFTPRRIAEMAPMIQNLVDAKLDAVPAGSVFEAISGLAFPLPFDVISHMLGMGETDRDRVRDVSGLLVRNLEPLVDPDLIRSVAAAQLEMEELLSATISWKRENPGDDLLTLLIEAEEDGDRLSDIELLSQVALLFIAGHETTVNLIGNGLLALARNPDQFALLKSSPELIDNAVDEMLRYDCPVQMTRRIPLVDIEVGGRSVPKGTFVVAALASANRDESHFGTDADRFDITRANAREHLSFGGGSHYCLGASLARLEAKVAIGSVVERWDGLSAPDELDYNGRINLRGLETLPLGVV